MHTQKWHIGHMQKMLFLFPLQLHNLTTINDIVISEDTGSTININIGKCLYKIFLIVWLIIIQILVFLQDSLFPDYTNYISNNSCLYFY